MATLILLLFAFFLFVFDSFFLLRLFSDLTSQLHGAPFVPIPIEVARESLRLAKIGPDDILCDLGCGDGRVLRLAAEEFGVKKALGYEIAIWPYLKFKIENLKREISQVKIYRKNLFAADLSSVTVVFLYLYPKLLERLKEKLLKELPSGALVISCRYGISGLRPTQSSITKEIAIHVYSKV